MSLQSLLVELDGSTQSRYAAETAWAIAKANNLSVNAQHVVDSLAAWDFLNFDIAGFIGSAPYFIAHQTMLGCLNDIGKNLIKAYSDQAAARDIPGGTFLDEGTTIREICRRAKDHSLVVIGQRNAGVTSAEEDKRRLPRRSVAETLTYYCPRPMLVIQDRAKPFTKLKLVIADTDIKPALLNSYFAFAESLNLVSEIRLLLVSESFSKDTKRESIDSNPDAQRLVQELSRKVPAFSKAQLELHRTKNLNEYLQLDAQEDSDSLLVVPVTEIGGIRRTPFGTAPDTLIRYMSHSAILLWLDEVAVESSNEKAVSRTV
ncbi:MAG: universal stress protein [Candidatus Obscuribacterales bacterium]|nr:universal stress protein [Candidatus Obscuribacterales bacterium]